MPAEPGTIEVEVVYALPEKQWCRRIAVPCGTTVRDAIERSGLLAEHPGIDAANLMVGIWNHRCSLDSTVRAQDRIEVYRPLTADPKEARRRRARNR